MITDKEKIADATGLVTRLDSYIPLTMQDFEMQCKDPDGLIHVVGKDAGDAIEMLSREYAGLPPAGLSSVLGFVRSGSLTMGDLDRLCKGFPTAGWSKWGIAFDRPVDGEVEVFLFFRA